MAWSDEYGYLADVKNGMFRPLVEKLDAHTEKLREENPELPREYENDKECQFL